MLPPLSDSLRETLLRLAALVCASALCLIPFASVSSPDGPAEAARLTSAEASLTLPTDSAAPVPAALRDPFVASPRAIALESAARSTGVVRAVALGAEPRAIVDTGGATLMVKVGEALMGSNIVEIDAGGVVLEDGLRLNLGNVSHP